MLSNASLVHGLQECRTGIGEEVSQKLAEKTWNRNRAVASVMLETAQMIDWIPIMKPERLWTCDRSYNVVRRRRRDYRTSGQAYGRRHIGRSSGKGILEHDAAEGIHLPDQTDEKSVEEIVGPSTGARDYTLIDVEANVHIGGAVA